MKEGDEKRLKRLERETKTLIEINSEGEFTIIDAKQCKYLLDKISKISPNHIIKKGQVDLPPVAEILIIIDEVETEVQAKQNSRFDEVKSLLDSLDIKKELKENPEKIKELYNVLSDITKEFEVIGTEYRTKWFDILYAHWLSIDDEDTRSKLLVLKEMCRDFPKGFTFTSGKKISSPCEFLSEITHENTKFRKKRWDVIVVDTPSLSEEERREFYENLRRSDPAK